jgi:hypothetical protein
VVSRRHFRLVAAALVLDAVVLVVVLVVEPGDALILAPATLLPGLILAMRRWPMLFHFAAGVLALLYAGIVVFVPGWLLFVPGAPLLVIAALMPEPRAGDAPPRRGWTTTVACIVGGSALAMVTLVVADAVT